jgi:hypothetical protein
MALYDFGLTEEQFWRLTPAQFGALSKRKDEENRHNDWRFGMIVSTIANLFIKERSQRIDAFEAMGHGKGGSGVAQREQSEAETALRFRLFQASQKRAKLENGKS